MLPNSDDLPLIEMKEKCPFLMAFTAEVMRFKSVVPFALPHKALEDGVIAGHPIMKGSTVMTSLHHCMEDESVWKNPNDFDPMRFIDEETGQFVQRPNNSWLPFSTGRRSCIGEKLAIANMFLIILRFFQKTRGFRYEVTPSPKSETEKQKLLTPDASKVSFYEPQRYKIRLVSM